MSKPKNVPVAKTNEMQPKVVNMPDEPQVAQILESLPPEKRDVILAAIKQESYSGPLPHPDFYEGYEKVLPGSANRILTMTETQVQHRVNIEGQIVNRTLTQKSWGMVIGGILTIIILAAVVFLGINGHDILAGTLGTTTIIGVIVVYVLGQKPGEKEDQKNQHA